MTPLPSWVRRNRTAVTAGNTRLNTALQQMKARHSKYLAMLKASGGYSVPLSGASSALPLSAANAETNTPLIAQEAQGNNSLDVSQRGAVIGEVIPIVFARRVSGVGGVLISPAATEARFENSVTNEVTGFYHLVLGEGPMDSLQVRDVFQRSCRVGSFSQTYNRRAGTFIPGNFIVPRAGYTVPECPSYCGTGGTYTGLSTLAFQATYPDGITQWNRQVHCFVRGGLYVTRLLDSVTGPSNNVADLLRYLLRSSSRVPDAQIDAAGSFLAAATFTNVNGFWFNGSINASTNLRDWIGRNLQYFLLRLVRVAGKESLKPLLPTNANGTIKTTAVDWEFAFTEEHIIPDSFEIDYTPLADRKPFAVMVLWRQQDDLGIPLVRTAEVRYPGTAIDGPFEQHDLSAFCASENHAVKAGTYILSRRNHITHRLRIAVRPDAFNPTLAAGDRVRVRLERTPSTGAASVHDYLYEVDRIGKSISGEVRLELTHFPIDSSFASVVAKEVDAAVGAGFVLPTGLSGITCDVNSSADTSVPADTSLDPGDWDIPADGSFDVDVTELDPTDLDDMPSTSIDALAVGGIGGLGGGGGGGGGDPTKDNPEDDKDNQEDAPDPFLGYPAPGDGRYPPAAPAGLEPILMGDGEPAPGYPPTEWSPGTWSSTFEIPAHEDSIYGDTDPGAPGLQCGVVQTNNIPGSGVTTIPGPCWGLYRKVTLGLCDKPSTIVWYTAVIGNGFSYWQTLASFSGGSYGADTIDPVITNVFTPL